MWGACTQSHEWAWLCDKLSVSWLLISPGCTANTVLAVKHLIYWQKELVFDPTFRTSAGNRFLTPSRIFLLSVVQQKPTNPIVALVGEAPGKPSAVSRSSMFTNSDEQNWQHGRPEKLAKGKCFLHYKHSDYSNHQERLPMVMIAHLTPRSLCGGRGWRSFIFTQEGRLFVALTDKICHRIGWSLR